MLMSVGSSMYSVTDDDFLVFCGCAGYVPLEQVYSKPRCYIHLPLTSGLVFHSPSSSSVLWCSTHCQLLAARVVSGVSLTHSEVPVPSWSRCFTHLYNGTSAALGQVFHSPIQSLRGSSTELIRCFTHLYNGASAELKEVLHSPCRGPDVSLTSLLCLIILPLV
jgi:hypothetical protein